MYNGATCLYKSHFCGLNSYKSVLADLVGVYYDEGPPVPIPNTVVKLIRAENTWLEAAREDRLLPVGNRTAENIRSAVFRVRQFLYA